MILLKIPGIPGDSNINGYVGDYFSAESISFGHERELKDSGKSGTLDINVGVCEFQEVSISKSMDKASTTLARRAISGSSCGKAEICFVETITGDDQEAYNVEFLKLAMDNVIVKTWSISGDSDERPSEEVTFWYNRIAFQYWYSPDGKVFQGGGSASWDKTTQTSWEKGLDGIEEQGKHKA